MISLPPTFHLFWLKISNKYLTYVTTQKCDPKNVNYFSQNPKCKYSVTQCHRICLVVHPARSSQQPIRSSKIFNSWKLRIKKGLNELVSFPKPMFLFGGQLVRAKFYNRFIRSYYSLFSCFPYQRVSFVQMLLAWYLAQDQWCGKVNKQATTGKIFDELFPMAVFFRMKCS